MRRFLATFLVELLTFGLFPQPVVMHAAPKPEGPVAPDPASGRDLPGERFLRSLLRNVSGCDESARASRLSQALPDTPTVNGLSGVLLTDNPNS